MNPLHTLANSMLPLPSRKDKRKHAAGLTQRNVVLIRSRSKPGYAAPYAIFRESVFLRAQDGRFGFSHSGSEQLKIS